MEVWSLVWYMMELVVSHVFTDTFSGIFYSYVCGALYFFLCTSTFGVYVDQCLLNFMHDDNPLLTTEQ
jgi:cell shape-determining protein MreD